MGFWTARGAMPVHTRAPAASTGGGPLIAAGRQIGEGDGLSLGGDSWCSQAAKAPLVAWFLNSPQTPPVRCSRLPRDSGIDARA